MSGTHNLIVLGQYKKENFYCEICNFPLVSNKDFQTNETNNCCNECYMQFVESRRNEWKNGWRPNKTDVGSYISIRRKLYKIQNKEK